MRSAVTAAQVELAVAAAERRGHRLGPFEEMGEECVAACSWCGRRAFVLADGSFEGAAYVGRCRRISPLIKLAPIDTPAEKPPPVLGNPAEPVTSETPDPVFAAAVAHQQTSEIVEEAPSVASDSAPERRTEDEELPVAEFLVDGVVGRSRVVRRDDGERDRTLDCSCGCRAWATSEKPWTVMPCTEHGLRDRNLPIGPFLQTDLPCLSSVPRPRWRKRAVWFGTLRLMRCARKA